eukprot:365569-Chlamydomonas_euryale.AAC.4
MLVWTRCSRTAEQWAAERQQGRSGEAAGRQWRGRKYAADRQQGCSGEAAGKKRRGSREAAERQKAGSKEVARGSKGPAGQQQAAGRQQQGDQEGRWDRRVKAVGCSNGWLEMRASAHTCGRCVTTMT